MFGECRKMSQVMELRNDQSLIHKQLQSIRMRDFFRSPPTGARRRASAAGWASDACVVRFPVAQGAARCTNG